MLIHRRAPKSGTSRGPDLGHIGGHPGDAGKPQKNIKKPGPGGLFWGGPGGVTGVFLERPFLGQKWGFSDPPENTGFPGVRGAEKVLI
jgi:hypothetical protein